MSMRTGNTAGAGGGQNPVPLAPIGIRLRVTANPEAAYLTVRIAPRPAPRHPWAAPDAGVNPHRRVFRFPCRGPAWPGCLGIARCTLVPDFLCECRNENAPGMESEGIRCASEDRGDRSPGKGVDLD